MYKILKNTIEMDDYSVQKLSNLQPPEPFEWNTVEGTELNVSDCIGGKGKIEVKGNTEQEQLSGNQLYDVLDVYNASSEITVDEEGWITATYDNTAGSSAKYLLYYTNKSDLLETNKSYAIFTEIKSVNGTGILYAISIYDNQSQSSASLAYNFNGLSNNSIKKSIFNTSSDFNTANTMLRTLIQIRPGESGSITFRLSVLENTDTTIEQFLYEKYCGGQASPNPEYPQEIKVVTGDNVVKHVGKNLLDTSKMLRFMPTVANWVSLDGIERFYNATNIEKSNLYYDLKPNIQYTFSIHQYNNIKQSNSTPFQLVDSAGKVVAITNLSNLKVTFSVNEATRVYPRIIVAESNMLTQCIVQLEESSTATPYEQYRGEEYELNLGNIELCKIGNYEDILFKNEVGNTNYNSSLVEGAWYKKNVVGKVVLDGSESGWSVANTGTDNYYYRWTYRTRVITGMTLFNYYVNAMITNSNVERGAYLTNITSENSQLRIRYGTEDTLENYNSWLSTHNLIVYHAFETPTYTQITDTTLISQLEALRKAKWFKGVNHWWTETNNLEPVLKGTYKQAINE